MLTLEPETGLALTGAASGFNALLLVVNILVGQWFLAAANLATFGLCALVAVRWFEILHYRRCLG